MTRTYAISTDNFGFKFHYCPFTKILHVCTCGARIIVVFLPRLILFFILRNVSSRKRDWLFSSLLSLITKKYKQHEDLSKCRNWVSHAILYWCMIIKYNLNIGTRPDLTRKSYTCKCYALNRGGQNFRIKPNSNRIELNRSS